MRSTILQFLISLAILFASSSCDNNEELFLYVGTYTGEGSQGIYTAKYNPDSGELSEAVLAAELKNPNFQAVSEKGQLWSAFSGADGKGHVHGFSIDENSDQLNSLEAFESMGYGTCHVSYVERESCVLAANYGSGNCVCIPVDDHGKASGKISSHQHLGSGPDSTRQEGPHAHCIKPDLEEKFIYSADLGTDIIYVYTIENKALKLFKEIKTSPGAGPRHLTFHPSKQSMAVVNELNNTVSMYMADDDGCFSREVDNISTLPESFDEFSKSADIHFTPDGRFLYASNRGYDSIVIYKVNPETMQLSLVGWMEEGINWPRNFIISPDGHFLLAANRNANNITVYKIDRESGQLAYTGNNLNISKPVCLNLVIQ